MHADVQKLLKRVSILVPVFNEERYLETVIERVVRQGLPGDPVKQVIIVNDASTDGSGALMRRIPARYPGTEFVLIDKAANEGKGAALRDAWARADGDVLVIQDADLEYDPADYPKLLAPIIAGQADCVFGSRFIGEPHRVLYFWHQVANRFLTTLSNVLTNLNLSDMEVCYKVFAREVYTQIKISSRRFGVEPELAAKVSRLRLAEGRRVRVFETGVAYAGRTYGEGKKIGWKDGLSAVFHIIWFRFMD